MKSMRLEDYTPLPAMIRHRKVSDTSTPVSAVEAWLDEHPEKRIENKENGGIGRSTKTVVFVDTLKRDLAPSERKKVKAQARKDYKKALRNLSAQKSTKKPVKTPVPILEAAYREFKRIAEDNDTTIEQIISAKRGH